MTRRPLSVPLEVDRHRADLPWGRRLAMESIESSFGPFAARVAEGAVSLGRPTRAELVGWLSRACPGEDTPTLAKKVHRREA